MVKVRIPGVWTFLFWIILLNIISKANGGLSDFIITSLTRLFPDKWKMGLQIVEIGLGRITVTECNQIIKYGYENTGK
jgi:hypothetical protein